MAENQLRNDVLLALPQSNREYLKDTRLERQSVDRYLAELEKLEGHLDQTHIVTSNKEDSKTISFAFNEYYSGEIEKQSRSLALIKKIGLKHSLSADQLSYSWRRGHEDEEIIEFARYYQFEEIRRNKKIFQFLVVSLLLTLFHLIFPQIINFSSTLLILVLTNYLLLGTLLVLWRFTNKKPRLPDVEEYRAMRSILSLLVLVSGFLLFLRSDQTLI